MIIDLFGWLELVKLCLDMSFVNVFFLVGLKGVDELGCVFGRVGHVGMLRCWSVERF